MSAMSPARLGDSEKLRDDLDGVLSKKSLSILQQKETDFIPRRIKFTHEELQ